MIAQAADLQRQNRHDQAVALLQAAQAASPKDPTPFLGAAISLLALKNPQAALTQASLASWRNPQLPEAHYVAGQAHAALGDAANARRAFSAALRLRPVWADAWVNYGLAAYRDGSVEEAIRAMRRAQIAEPNHGGAAANLAAFLRLSGAHAEAESLLRRLLAEAPENHGARFNLIADLLQHARPAEALALLEGEIPADPRVARFWLLQKSLALLELDRAEEAHATLDALLDLGPTPPALRPQVFWRIVLLKQRQGDRDGARGAARAMERALEQMGPEAVPEHEVIAHYDLAEFWSQNEDPARAMDHWTQAHGKLAKFQPFSRATHRNFIDRTIATFNAARFAEGPRAKNRDPAPVFIVGMPRCGATRIEQTLAVHAACHGAGERAALGRLYAALAGDSGPERLASLDAGALDRAAEGFLAELRALAPLRPRIVDSMPGNFLHLGLVALLFPAAKIIHCRRDPRDMGLSIYSARFHGAHGYAHSLADLGWYIGAHDRLMAHWRAVLPNPILEIDYEDWDKDFDATLARLLTHLDLPADPDCDRFRARRRLTTQSGGWRAHEKALAPLIEELAKAGSLVDWD